jgi:NAD(P)-dependent dehydrogenase (short-subunit alcohol dehydrogenase family)
MDTPDLDGMTVIVTGASAGIGAATARLLHATGGRFQAGQVQRLSHPAGQAPGAAQTERARSRPFRYNQTDAAVLLSRQHGGTNASRPK